MIPMGISINQLCSKSEANIVLMRHLVEYMSSWLENAAEHFLVSVAAVQHRASSQFSIALRNVDENFQSYV
jgi:hypothetical protein